MIYDDVKSASRNKDSLPISKYLQSMDIDDRHGFIVKLLHTKYGNYLMVDEQYEDVEEYDDWESYGYVTPEMPEKADVIEDDYTPSTPIVPATYSDPPEGGDPAELSIIYGVPFKDLIEFLEYEYDLFDEYAEAFFNLYVYSPKKRDAYLEKKRKKEEERKKRQEEYKKRMGK